jgi:DNA-binding transcriptional MerR regulator
MKQDNGYRASVAVEAAGLRSHRCLDYWDQLGLVRPSIKKSRGKGFERRYSFEDLIALRVVKKLREEGLSLQKIRSAVRRISVQSRKPLKEYLVTDGKEFQWIRKDGKIEDLLSRGQLVFTAVSLVEADRQVCKALKLPSGNKMERVSRKRKHG